MSPPPIPDFDDGIPETKDLVPPDPKDYGTAILGNTIAVRHIRKDLAAAKKAFIWMAVTFVTGSIGVAGTVINAMVARGAEQERARVVQEQVQDHQARIVALEQKVWRDDHEREEGR